MSRRHGPSPLEPFIAHAPDEVDSDWHVVNTMESDPHRDPVSCTTEAEARGYASEMNADPALWRQARPMGDHDTGAANA